VKPVLEVGICPESSLTLARKHDEREDDDIERLVLPGWSEARGPGARALRETAVTVERFTDFARVVSRRSADRIPDRALEAPAVLAPQPARVP
jgi:hypothetical protein